MSEMTRLAVEFLEAVEEEAREGGRPDPDEWPSTLALAYRAVQFWTEDYVVAPWDLGLSVNPLWTAKQALDVLSGGVERWGEEEEEEVERS
jgi:hypothetical protein